MLLSNLNLLATAPGGVARLRELILTLAVQGKLLPQDPQDEPARVLLQNIRAEKDRLMAEGKIKRDKPLAAIAEEEKPFEVPVGWEWVRLGDIGYTNIGLTYSPNNVSETGTPVLRSNNVQAGKLDLSDLKRVNMRVKESVLVAEGDLLICARNGSKALVGKTAMITGLSEEMAFGAFMAIFRSEANGYVLHFINSPLFRRMISDVNTTTINQITQENLRGTVFPLPPLPEQTRIVTRVEELMRLCDALESKGQLEAAQHTQLVSTLLATLTDSATPAALSENWQRLASHFDLLLDRPQAVDALEQTILQLAVRGLLVPQDPAEEPARVLLQTIRAEKDRLIAAGQLKRDKPLPPVAQDEQPFALPQGWEWTRFGDLALISSGITLGRKTAIPSPVFLPYLRVANVQRWRLNLTSMKEVVIDRTELDRFQIVNGDLLITEGGDWDKVGRTAIWRDELPTCLHQNHVFKARGTSPDWNPVWAELYLNSMVARSYFASSAKQTTNLASINMTQLKNCMFPVPTLPEQARIVARVEALRGLCADLRQRLAASQRTQAQLAEALVSGVAARQ